MSWCEDFDKLFAGTGIRLTFSINCHSGISSLLEPGHQCGCWRCREGRGQPWDEATEEQAAKDSRRAQQAMREFAIGKAGA
jgi:hypothetical protein